MVIHGADIQTVVTFLTKVKGFKAIPRDDLVQLAHEVEYFHGVEGDYLIRKGDKGDSMHVIGVGRVRIPVRDETGHIKLSVTLEAGAIVGEMALLTGEPRAADVICDSKVTTYVFRREVLEKLLRAHPPLAQFLTEILAERMDEDRTLQKVGNYRLGRELGKGMTSVVYEATHNLLSRLVAAKMLSHSLVYDSGFLERFLQEARTIAELTHPNIVHVYDLEEAYGTRFIIMELVKGQSLDVVLSQRKKLEPLEAMVVLRQVASALAFAHERGIAHRDVKPANCILGNDHRVRLLDFGIAQRFGKDGETHATPGGTPAYIAPEVISGQASDGRADFYSLGAMAFKLVTGRAVFREKTVEKILDAHLTQPVPDPRELVPEIPDGLATFIVESLIKDPEKRLKTWDRVFHLLGPADDRPLPVGNFVANSEMETVLLSYPKSLKQKMLDVLRVLRELGVNLTTLSGAPALPLGEEYGHAAATPAAALSGPARPGASSAPAPSPGGPTAATEEEWDDSEATEVDLGLTNPLIRYPDGGTVKVAGKG